MRIERCPFCGGDAAVVPTNPNRWRVECNVCLAAGPERSSEAEAVEAWNERRGEGCPFCGGRDLVTYSYGQAYSNGRYFYHARVMCRACGSEGPLAVVDDKKEAMREAERLFKEGK